MSRVDGVKITAAPDDRARRRRLFDAAVRSLVSGVVLSKESTMMFHGDPHAGNLMATDDGQLALLDWSLAGELTSVDRRALAQIALGGLSLDAARIGRAIDALASQPPAESVVRRHVETALGTDGRSIWQHVPSPKWAISLLDNLALAGVRFPHRLMLFRKSYFTIRGVLADVDPTGCIDTTLMSHAITAFVHEWPSRLFKPPHAVDNATHLSTADLLTAAAIAPTAMMSRMLLALTPGSIGFSAPATCVR
jgi:ubiquinone biosynthesis protein